MPTADQPGPIGELILSTVEVRQPPAAICVPVRNERRRLPALLAALARQTGCDLARITVCFLFDDCEDGSEAFVRAHADAAPFRLKLDRAVGSALPNAGAARRLAVCLGEAEIAGSADAVLITTDADSVPADDWIAASLRGLRGADIVAGRVERADARTGDRLSRLEAYLDRLYALRRVIDPVPWEDRSAHHFTSGASLAFRAGAYRATGGFPPQPSGEDGAIIDIAERLGFRVRRDRSVLVTTSARRTGRAPDGLAATLRRLDRARCGSAPVGDPAAAVWQYEGHALARRLFEMLPSQCAVETLRRQIGLPEGEILEVAGECANAEAFAMRIVPPAPDSARTLPLEKAEQSLAALEQARLDRAA